jgi:hypothetical protein
MTAKTTTPPTNEEVNTLKIKDYGDSITKISHSLHVLEHALPLTRVPEIEQSFAQLADGVHALRVFLLVRGFDV